LSGISDEDFAEAEDTFAEVEGVADGLGPIFNEAACGNCHTQGALGGAGVQIERRFGRFVDGRFDPLENKGGSLRQLFSNGPFVNDQERSCAAVPLEVEPPEATVKNVGRLTTALFGLGLVDTISDETLRNIAASERGITNGQVNMVTILLPDPRDPTQRLGGQRAGRFGWKAQIPSLVQFSADAYVNEMGITTDHCIDGTRVLTFGVESKPNGVALDPECEDGIPGVDDGIGDCVAGQTTIQDDVELFTRFMEFLAPAPRGPGSTLQGQILFTATLCTGCHTSRTFRTPDKPFNGVPGNFAFRPFSDFLVHDMGSLGDRIGNPGDSEATTRRMRTAPLWGIRFRSNLLHDGRATNIRDAVLAHDGQARTSATLFRALPNAQKEALINYVNSL